MVNMNQFEQRGLGTLWDGHSNMTGSKCCDVLKMSEVVIQVFSISQCPCHKTCFLIDADNIVRLSIVRTSIITIMHEPANICNNKLWVLWKKHTK